MLPDFLVVVLREPAEGPAHSGIGAATVALWARLWGAVARCEPLHVGGAEFCAAFRTSPIYHTSIHILMV